ncbi:MAG TPA: Xaa-Pro dipeptidase [Polyangiaceae bacterium]|nr:Xaa-Pro dipeptidase [Polyangiaceae bacterium]
MDASGLDELYLAHVADLERRFASVLAEQGWDAVAIHSGSPVKRSQFDDQLWPLRPCPHFQHWLPLVEADNLLVVGAGTKPKLLRYGRRSFWEGPPQPESAAFADALEVIDLGDAAAAKAHVPGGRVAFVGEDAARAREWDIGPDAACPAALVLALDALRTTKTPYEVACIAEANRRARAGHEALRDAFRRDDVSELDLHLLFLRETAQDDPDTPYKNIVAFGRHAATLHHVAYGRHAPKRAAESLLVDAGATCRGYCSDVTRTWVKGPGAAASAFAHVVAGVEAMQQRLCAALRVGMPYEALHDESHRQVAAILREAGIVRASAEEAVASGVTRVFYPHGLGHSLGLQTHDVGCGLRAPREDNRFLRNTSDVTAGQVVTIEPGIYFIDTLLDQVRADPRRGRTVSWGLVDALVPLGGVRIEDDVLVLEDGVRNFTREQLPSGGGVVG